MAISVDETLLSLAAAAAELPRRRRGKPTHVSTLHRWATRGLRGVRLEVLRVGGTTCTSREALQRFFTRLTATTMPDRRQSSAGHAEEGSAVENELRLFGV